MKKIISCFLIFLIFPQISFAADKLLQQSDFTYLGAFRVPKTSMGSTYGLSYGGTALAYNQSNNSLFIVGHDSEQRVAEISIPNPINTSNVANMNTATVIQNLYDITEGNLCKIGANGACMNENKNLIGGLLVYGNSLIGSAYNFYDGNSDQRLTHFKSGKNLSTAGDFNGMFKVSNLEPLFVAGGMTTIPAEYQASLGGPVLTGLAGAAIISHGSWGPTAMSFNPDRLGIDNPVTGYPLVNYPIDHQTLGEWGHPLPPDEDIAIGDNITGIVFPSGTKTVLFTGKHGKGAQCYGTSVSNGDPYALRDGTCVDPVDSDKGTHSYPYVQFAWAYNVDDLISVKNGLKQPWEILPYAKWEWPYSSTFVSARQYQRSGASAYDEVNKRLYIVQVAVDDYSYPLIHVLQVNTGGSTPGDTTPPITSASPQGGTFTTNQTVTLSANESATIHYTTNGSNPTTSSNVYSSPIQISQTTTLKYFAKDTAGNSESVKTQTYTIAKTYSLSDVITLISNWLKVGTVSDVNGDNVVNARDLGVMMSSWN